MLPSSVIYLFISIDLAPPPFPSDGSLVVWLKSLGERSRVWKKQHCSICSEGLSRISNSDYFSLLDKGLIANSLSAFSQRPYHIRSSTAATEIAHVFKTATIMYPAAWSKDMVSLIQKVCALNAFSDCLERDRGHFKFLSIEYMKCMTWHSAALFPNLASCHCLPVMEVRHLKNHMAKA